MQVHRPRPDGAAARQRHPRRAEARHQRPQHQNAGAHAPHDVVAGLRVARAARIYEQHAGAALRYHSKLLHQAHHRGDIDEVGDVADLKRLGAEQRGGDLWQGRVLGAVNLDRAFEPVAAADKKPVHAVPSGCISS